MDSKNAWKQEYQKKGIPSSFRKDPTGVLVEFIAWLEERQKLNGRAADIGCGQGRNSFYLTTKGLQVVGIELLEENVAKVNAEARDGHLPIEAFAQDASAPWPIQRHSLDLAIDIFCYKHIVDKGKQACYRKELSQALKPEGYYFLSLASVDDGYYGPLLKDSPDAKNHLIIDPLSQIPSFLYTAESLQEEFAPDFHFEKLSVHTSESPMYGKVYPRVVLNAIMKPR